MIKKFLLIFLFISFESSYAKFINTDTNTINDWLSRSLVLLNSNPDSAGLFAKKGLSSSLQLGYKKGIARAFMRFGVLSNAEGKSDSALYYFKHAYRLRSTLKDIKGMANACREISYVYSGTANFDSAFSYCLTALHLNESINNNLEIGINCNDLGTLFLDYKNYKQAKYYFEKAIALLSKESDSTYFGLAYNGLASYYVQQNNYEKAEQLFQTALKINKQLGNLKAVNQNNTNLALCYNLLGQRKKSISYYYQALSYYLEENYFYEACIVYQALSEIYHQNHQNDSALVCLTKAIPLANQGGFKDLKAMCYKTLSDIYSSTGNYKEAFSIQQKYLELNDSLLNTEKVKQISEMQTKYETEKKDKEIILLNKDNELKTAANKREKLKFYYSVGILCIVGLFLFIVFIQKNKISREKKRSDQLVLDKEMLIKEIHHRVKNNLEVISSLLELQSEGIDNEKAKAAIVEGQNRVQSIALIHHKLYRTDNVSAVNFKSFANDLFNQVSSVFKKPGTEINFELEAPEIEISIDTAVPLGLILNELLTNSFKYAVNTASKNCIRIELRPAKEEALNTVLYRDNGPGLPDNYDLVKSSSLGMKVIQLLTKQLGGKLNFYNDNGSVFEIPFKTLEELV